MSIYTDRYLDRNPVFIKLVTNFHQGLKSAGSMFLTVYKDVPAAEAAQIDFYEHTGQHVVTPKGTRFVATRENFWSVRWSEASMLSNLREAGVEHVDVVFHGLNEIAWLVEITRQEQLAARTFERLLSARSGNSMAETYSSSASNFAF